MHAKTLALAAACALLTSAAPAPLDERQLFGITFPTFKLPSIGLPSIGLPSIGLPSIGLPSIGLPGLPTPTTTPKPTTTAKPPTTTAKPPTTTPKPPISTGGTGTVKPPPGTGTGTGPVGTGTSAPKFRRDPNYVALNEFEKKAAHDLIRKALVN